MTQAELRNGPILFSKKVLSEKDKYLIFETETTGLGENDVILWISIMDLDGKMILDHLLKLPKGKHIDPAAKVVHGIDRSMLKTATDFMTILPDIEEIASEKIFLIFNEEFHARMFDQTMAAHGFRKPIYFNSVCVQKLLNQYIGRNYSKLPNRDNSGEGDCLAVLNLIKKIASGEEV